MTTDQSGLVKDIYRDGQFVSNEWLVVSDEDDISQDAAVFVSFTRGLELLQQGEGANLPQKLGFVVEPQDEVETLEPYLQKLDAIAVAFPAFGNGVAFSTARLLRERYGFEGEIRAVGDYILDQMPMLQRCGVDSFKISDDKVRAGLERGEWPDVTLYYQPTGQDGQNPIATRPWLRTADSD